MLTNSGWLLTSWWVSRIRASKAVSRVGDDESDHHQGVVNNSSTNVTSSCLPYSPMGLSPAWTSPALLIYKLIGFRLAFTLHKSCVTSSINEFLLWLVSLTHLIVLCLEGWEWAVSWPYLSRSDLVGECSLPLLLVEKSTGAKDPNKFLPLYISSAYVIGWGSNT